MDVNAWIMADPVVVTQSGTATINLYWPTTVAGSGPHWFEYFTCNLDAGTIGTVYATLNAAWGTLGNVTLKASAPGDLWYIYFPTRPILLADGDYISLNYANTYNYSVGFRAVGQKANRMS